MTTEIITPSSRLLEQWAQKTTTLLLILRWFLRPENRDNSFSSYEIATGLTKAGYSFPKQTINSCIRSNIHFFNVIGDERDGRTFSHNCKLAYRLRDGVSVNFSRKTPSIVKFIVEWFRQSKNSGIFSTPHEISVGLSQLGHGDITYNAVRTTIVRYPELFETRKPISQRAFALKPNVEIPFDGLPDKAGGDEKIDRQAKKAIKKPKSTHVEPIQPNNHSFALNWNKNVKMIFGALSTEARKELIRLLCQKAWKANIEVISMVQAKNSTGEYRLEMEFSADGYNPTDPASIFKFLSNFVL